MTAGDDLSALEALARAATPGPWGVDEIGSVWFDGDQWPVAISAQSQDRDASYIAAACNALPGLIARVWEAEGAVARVSAVIDEHLDLECGRLGLPCPDAMADEPERWCRGCAIRDALRGALRAPEMEVSSRESNARS